MIGVAVIERPPEEGYYPLKRIIISRQ
jgi:hypothetical protein